MPHLKRLDRSATLAWCPERAPGGGPSLIAAGTVAGAVDMTFSTTSVLELVSLDFAASGDQPSIAGSIQAPERFNRLAWGHRVQGDSASPPLGLLAGGLADGSVCVWDPAAILSPGGHNPVVARMQKHAGAVKGLEFNPFSPNLLASGAGEGELCIWDLINPSKPAMYPVLKNPAAPPTTAGAAPSITPGLEITYISWNRKVQHILASCHSNGTTVVWDLKKQKPVISFRDPNSQRRASVLQWNPDVATQLVVASDDDRSPTLQLWDLRNSVSPLKEFVGHTKGVLGMSWSPHDSSLLLSSGKDNRNVCWDVTTTDVLCELAPSSNWNFDVQWCPTIPGVFSTASFDGHVGVYNLHACTLGKVVETVNHDFSVTQTTVGESVPLRKAPAWMKRSAGVSWGFGGRLVSFSNNKVSAMDTMGQAVQHEVGSVTMKQIVTEQELVQRSEAFEQAIAGGEKPTLEHYCLNKAAGAADSSADESEEWTFMALMFEPDGRRGLLKKLGFQDVLTHQESGVDTNGVEQAAAGVDGLSLDGKPGGAHGANGVAAPAPEAFFHQEDATDFFDKLPDEGLLAPISPAAAAGGTPRSALGSAKAGADHVDGDTPHSAAGEGFAGHVDASLEQEDVIQRAMIAGNYEAAVDACFKAHRLADALLIANVFNVDLYKRTMHRYMQMVPKPYMSILRANMDNDWAALVKTRSVGQWRDTLALLATYASHDQWLQLCEMLAGRLAAAGQHHAALLCHICAGNLDGAVSYWANTVKADRPETMQAVLEKAVIMGLATNRKSSAALSDLVTAYASQLAAQGQLTTALDYLDHVMGEASTSVAELRDRIYRSGTVQLPHGTHPPPFPFIMTDVRPDVPAQPAQQPASRAAAQPSYAAQQQAQQQQQQQYRPAAVQQQQQQQASTPAYGAHAQHGYAAQQHQPQQQQAQAQQARGVYYQAPTQPAYNDYSQQQAATASQGVYGRGGAATAAAPSYQAASSHYYSQPGGTAGAYGQPGGTAGAYGQPAAAQQQPQQPAFTPTTTAAAYSAQPSFMPTVTGAGATMAAAQQAQQQQQPAYGQQQSAYAAPPQAPPPAYHQDASQQVYAQPKRASASQTPVAAAQPNAGAATPTAAQATHSLYAQQPGAASPTPMGSTAASAYGATAPTATQFVPSAPTAGPVGGGFMAGAGGAPGMMAGGYGAMPGAQPAATAQPPAKPAAPPPPPGPPANISVATADTSKVAPEHKPIVTSLTNLFNSCAALATNPAKKREMDDNSKKLGQLLWRLNAGDVSEGVLPKLLQLCQAIDAGDWHTANHLQVQMTTTDWEECGFWLAAVKRLIKMRQQGA